MQDLVDVDELPCEKLIHRRLTRSPQTQQRNLMPFS
jgi:hypothetical protein